MRRSASTGAWTRNVPQARYSTTLTPTLASDLRVQRRVSRQPARRSSPGGEGTLHRAACTGTTPSTEDGPAGRPGRGEEARGRAAAPTVPRRRRRRRSSPRRAAGSGGAGSPARGTRATGWRTRAAPPPPSTASRRASSVSSSMSPESVRWWRTAPASLSPGPPDGHGSSTPRMPNRNGSTEVQQPQVAHPAEVDEFLRGRGPSPAAPGGCRPAGAGREPSTAWSAGTGRTPSRCSLAR